MSKLKILIISIIILFILITIFMFDIVIPFIFQSEKIGFYEVKMMVIAKYDRSQIFVEAGENIVVPLSLGIVKFKNEIYSYDNQYLVSNKKIRNFLDNREKILDKYNLICEQTGSNIIIKNKYNDEKYLNISMYQYTSKFIRLIVDVVN